MLDEFHRGEKRLWSCVAFSLLFRPLPLWDLLKICPLFILVRKIIIILGKVSFDSFLRPCPLRLVNICGSAMHDNPSLPLRQRIAKRHRNGCLSISRSIGTCHGTNCSFYSILDDWSRSVLFHWRSRIDHSVPYVKIVQNYLRNVASLHRKSLIDVIHAIRNMYCDEYIDIPDFLTL